METLDRWTNSESTIQAVSDCEEGASEHDSLVRSSIGSETYLQQLAKIQMKCKDIQKQKTKSLHNWALTFCSVHA